MLLVIAGVAGVLGEITHTPEPKDSPDTKQVRGTVNH